jgi:hypothetical protein
MHGRPVRIVRSVFNMVAFKNDGTMVPPLEDHHIRARAELAAALRRRIEQIALGHEQCPRISAGKLTEE